MKPYNIHLPDEIAMTQGTFTDFDQKERAASHTLREYVEAFGYEFDSKGNAVRKKHGRIYDWYTIGGHWNGIFKPKNFPLSSNERALENNLTSVKEAQSRIEEEVKQKGLHYIIDKTGKLYKQFPSWNEHITKQEAMKQFKLDYQRILQESLATDYVVNIDLHN